MNKKILLGLLLLPVLSFAGISVDLRFGEPPPPRHEEFGRPPHRGYVWTNGYYRWDGVGHYVWEPGRWMRPPRRRAVWVPHHWQRTPRGWVMEEGHWR